jgi:hypothetical protein
MCIYARAQKRKKHRDNFFLIFLVTFFLCVIIYNVIREKENIEIFVFLDIHLFEQQKIMITHTHKQTDIKKEEEKEDHE